MSKTALLTALNTLGYDVILQGTLADDEPIPATFITFITISSETVQSFDNAPVAWQWRYQVTIYSNSPTTLATLQDTVRTTLKTAGFIPIGKGRDIPSGMQSHTGWTQDYYYLEK